MCEALMILVNKAQIDMIPIIQESMWNLPLSSLRQHHCTLMSPLWVNKRKFLWFIATITRNQVHHYHNLRANTKTLGQKTFGTVNSLCKLVFFICFSFSFLVIWLLNKIYTHEQIQKLKWIILFKKFLRKHNHNPSPLSSHVESLIKHDSFLLDNSY